MTITQALVVVGPSLAAAGPLSKGDLIGTEDFESAVVQPLQ